MKDERKAFVLQVSGCNLQSVNKKLLIIVSLNGSEKYVFQFFFIYWNQIWTLIFMRKISEQWAPLNVTPICHQVSFLVFIKGQWTSDIDPKYMGLLLRRKASASNLVCLEGWSTQQQAKAKVGLLSSGRLSTKLYVMKRALMRQSLWLIDLSIGSIRKSLLLSVNWFLKLRLIWKSLDQSVVSEVDEDNGWCSWLLPLSLQL